MPYVSVFWSDNSMHWNVIVCGIKDKIICHYTTVIIWCGGVQPNDLDFLVSKIGAFCLY